MWYAQELIRLYRAQLIHSFHQVVEVVGLSAALRMSFDILRNWGVISR